MQIDDKKIKKNLTIESLLKKFEGEKTVTEKQLKNFKPSIWQSIKGINSKYYLDQKEEVERKIKILKGIIEKRNTLKSEIDTLFQYSLKIEKKELRNEINKGIKKIILDIKEKITKRKSLKNFY